MKRDKLFDVIVYRFLLSIPVSCVANFVYGFALCAALWACSGSKWVSFGNSEYIYIILFTSSAIVPFILFNMIRYLAIKNGYLKYGIKGLIFSAIPEYLFLVILIVIWAIPRY